MKNVKEFKKWSWLPFFFLTFACVSAQMVIKGKVTTPDGRPVSGAVVTPVGQEGAAVFTENDGSFQLTVTEKAAQNGMVTLSVSSTDFETVVSTVDYAEGGTETVDVAFEKAVASGQLEVVSVGYGKVKKKDATGAVAVISEKDFNKGLNSNVEQLITGRIAGVTITQGGRPGDGAAIRIRGGASLSASNDPLVVVDNLPIEGGLSTINPNDIESISILKDASATAIFGSRASNGVVLITLKKGSKKGLSVSYNNLITLSTLAKKVDVLSADQFRDFINTYGNATQQGLLGNANTDWQDEIFSNAIMFNNDLAASGMLFNRIPTRLGLGYNVMPGILETSLFQRTTANLSMNPSFFNDHLKFNINANLSYQRERFANEGAIGAAISFDPTQPVFDPSSIFGGYFEWFDANGDYVLLATRNPVSTLRQQRNIFNQNRFFGNFQMEYKFHFLPELKAIVNLGFDENVRRGRDEIFNTSRNGFLEGTISGGTFVNKGALTNSNGRNENRLMDIFLNYTKDFGKVLVDVTAGHTYQRFENWNFSLGNIFDNVVPQFPLYIDPDRVLMSYFTRANISISGKYLLTLNYRRDATSIFIDDYRWGNFPGAAFAWRISEENFMKNQTFFNDLKLRLGWGITGQQDITRVPYYIQRYTLSNQQAQYQFGSDFFITARPEVYNRDLKWEETTTYNIGFDFAIFNNRLSGTLDLFYKLSDDLLAFVPLPDGAGLGNAGFRNFGSFSSRGVELGINYKIIDKADLQWDANFNATYNKLRIESLAGDEPGFIGQPVGGIAGGVGNTIQIHTPGFAPFSFYVYEQVYDSNGKPIEGLYVDRNGDGVITPDDMYHYKKPNADFTFGLQTNLSYKNWDASIQWRASLGNYVYDNVNSNRGYRDAGTRRDTDLSNITPDFFNTGFLEEGNNRLLSDYYIKNASWLKWDNLTIGYSFQEPFGDRTKLRTYFGMQNILIISPYDGIDPEIFSGIDNLFYPRARMFMFGMNFNF